MADKDRVRKKQIHLYITEEEHKILMDKAEYVGLNASQFIRNIIIDDNITKLPVEEILEISKAISEYKYELNKIGNNINQLMKVIHENNDLYSLEEINQARSLIENAGDTFDELTKVIYEKLYEVK